MSKPCNVLVIADGASGSDSHAEAIIARLSHSRLSHKACYIDNQKLNGIPRHAPDAIVFIFRDTVPDFLPLLVSKLKASYSGAVPSILGVIAPDTDEHLIEVFDSTLFTPLHPAQVIRRIMTVLRMTDIKQEIEFRDETYRSLTGHEYEDSLDKAKLDNLRVLFIGKAAPEFMSVMNAFNDSGVDVVAAFTSFTAFDFLHDQSFNAVVINAIHSTDSAFAIASTMRRNTKLFHVPAFALVGDQLLADEIEAYENGINDILDAHAPASEIRGRVMELATYHRAHDYVRSLYEGFGGEQFTDAGSGLLNGTFFKAHMQRHFTQSQKQSTALSLAQITCVPTSESFDITQIDDMALSKAQNQIGGMIKNMIRAQDCVSRINASQFAILFPNRTNFEVESIMDRLSNIINCTAFDHYETAFKLSLNINITQLSGSVEPDSTTEHMAKSA